MGVDGVVVGGGIGGLATAVALSQQGWQVRVLEQAPALEAVGAGLVIAPNALRVLDLLGGGSAVRDLAALHGEGGIRRADGRWLAKTNAEAFGRRVGVPALVARRSDVIAILHDLLPAGVLRLGTQVRLIVAGDATSPAVVRTNAESFEADLVVCADGIWSHGRRTLFPTYPDATYSGCTAWRFIAASSDDIRPAETWGPGKVFGLFPLTGGEVYCYAMAYAPAGACASSELAELQRMFTGWHDPIPQLLATVRPQAVLRGDVYDLPTPLPPFHAGRVALLGDAAHAMTPNMGQGACQAFEDAAVLAYRARSGGDRIADALADYERDRRRRVTGLVRQSRRMMKLVQLSAPPAVAVRNFAMTAARLLSEDMTSRLFLNVAGWRPPQEGQAAH